MRSHRRCERKREEQEYKEWLRRRGEEVIDELQAANIKGIVFSGHPYHIDPAVNHGLPEEIIAWAWRC